MEWFESWFDSEYYHKLYQHRNDEEAQLFISNLMQYLDLPKETHLLDLACGKGRHSVFLNQLGFQVTGVDLSPNSIKAANEFQSKNLHFKVQDMRVPFAESEFDAILNLFTSFGYFNNTSENLKVLNAISTMLKNGGIFVVDFMNASKVIEHLVPKEEKAIDNVLFRITRKLENGNIVKDIRFEVDQNEHHYTEKVQALKLSDFEELMAQTELKIDAIFGDYFLNEFNENTSDRLILVGSKL